MKVRQELIEKSQEPFEQFQNHVKAHHPNFLKNLSIYGFLNRSENLIFADELILGIVLSSNSIFSLNHLFLYDKKKKTLVERSYQSFFNKGFLFQGEHGNGFWSFNQKGVNLSYRSDFFLGHGYLHASINDALNLQLDVLINLSQKQGLKATSVLDFTGSVFSERSLGFQTQGVVSWNDQIYEFSPKTDRLLNFFSFGKYKPNGMNLYFYSHNKKESLAGYFSSSLDKNNQSENFLWTNGKPRSIGLSEFNLNRSQKTCVVHNADGIEMTFIPENYLIQKSIGKFFPENTTKVIGKVSCKLHLNKKTELIKDAVAILEY